MSRLTIGSMANIAGTGAINVATGHKLSQTGMIVQTVYARSDATTTYSSVGTGNGTTITALNLTITPKFSTSMLLMTWMVNCEFSVAAWDNVFVIHKDGALITTAGYQGYNNVAGNNRWSGLVGGQYDANADSTLENYRIQYFVPAGSTASATYAPAVRSASASSYTFYLNRTVFSIGDNYEVVTSSGIIQEIAQ